MFLFQLGESRMKNLLTFSSYLFTFKGRLNRKYFLIHYIVDTIIVFVTTLTLSWLMAVILLLIKHEPISEQSIRLKMGIYTGLFLTVCFLSNKISIVVRRLNDLGLNRWLVIIIFVPIVNLFFNLFLFFKKGRDSSCDSVPATGQLVKWTSAEKSRND